MKILASVSVLALLVMGTVSAAVAGDVAPAAAKSGSIAGTYDVRGTNPGGNGNYTGTAVITEKGDGFKIDWKVGTSYTGTGKRTGDTFLVEWGDGSATVGTVKYNVESDGRLTGIWYTKNAPNNLGSEILIPKK